MSRSRYSLSDLYDADLRATDRPATELAEALPAPHPLNNVQYADGISSCRHGKRHARFEHCPQDVIPDSRLGMSHPGTTSGTTPTGNPPR